MKLSGVIESTVVVVLHNPPDAQLFVPDLVTKLVEKYRFVEFPRTPDQFKSDVALFLGRFRQTTIEKLAVYTDGFLVSAPVDTTILDEFVLDLLTVIKEGFGLNLAGLRRQTFYNSKIEAFLNPGFENVLEKVGSVAARLDQMVSKHGMDASPYRGLSFGLFAEKIGPVAPGRFNVEPRGGHPLSDNCFFSEAPVTTEEHCELLRAVEQLF